MAAHLIESTFSLASTLSRGSDAYTSLPPSLASSQLNRIQIDRSADRPVLRAHCALTHSGLSNEIYVFAGEHEGAITFFNALARITGLIIFVPILGIKPDKRDTGTSCY